MRNHAWNLNTLWPALLAAMAVLGLGACSHEGSDWKSATAADTSESYQQFLLQHPNSANAVQAHARIEQLQEERDWQAASSADTRAAYEQFVAQHADGKWTQEARIRIENFAQSGGSAATVATVPPAAGAARVATAAASTAGEQFVQLGAFSSKAHAQWQWKRLSARFAHELGALSPRYVAAPAKQQPLVRLQVAVASREQAKSLCARLRAHSQPCVPVNTG